MYYTQCDVVLLVTNTSKSRVSSFTFTFLINVPFVLDKVYIMCGSVMLTVFQSLISHTLTFINIASSPRNWK